jgi:hypothetical protein
LFGGYYAYQKMQPQKVGLSGKEFNDKNVSKIVPGMPVYDNMVGKWSNGTKTLEIGNGKFIETVKGTTTEYDFKAYMNLPSACFPDGTSGNALGFSIINDKEVRCFALKELGNGKLGFVEVTSGEDNLESFSKI